MPVVKSDAIRHYISEVGALSDSDLDLFMAAISLAAQDSPDLSVEKYYHHIEKMIEQTRGRFDALIKAGSADDAGTRLAALKHVIADEHEYSGDQKTYDDLQNANLIRVIERRKGLPIALAIIYVHVGQAVGFDVVALSFPAHVICRLDHQGERLIFDPFDGCNVMQAADLRQMLKRLIGERAELSNDYFEASTKRQMLVRLQNNIKLRQIEAEDYQGALHTVEALQKIDPEEYRLLLDSGVLNARTGQLKRAITQLEDYIAKAPEGPDRDEAKLFLREIQNNLT